MKKPLALLAALTFLAGCGNVSRTAARDATAELACSRYQTCEQLGEGKAYPNRDECLLDWKNNINQWWPMQSCEDRISPQGLEDCHAAIRAYSCANITNPFSVDGLNVADKCQSARVCSGPPQS